MANNIQIIGNILNTNVIQRYSVEDVNLIANTEVQESFGGAGDYIEFYIYDAGSNLLSTNYNYLNYKLPSSTGLTPNSTPTTNTTGNIQTTDVGIISTFNPSTGSLYPIVEIDPVADIQNVGYSSGEFNAKYYFFQNKLSNSTDRALFIKEISADRTEIRLGSTSLTDTEIENNVNSIIEDINTSIYQIDNILNFGNNEQYLAINIALNKASSGYEVLFKMYEPLPLSVQLKQTLWIVHEKVDPYNFDINLDKLVLQPATPTLRGPNFDISIPDQGTVSTVYATYSNLVDSLQALQQSSFHQLSNLIASQSADINIDYTDYNNFVFFGSAYQRLSNFYGKAQQIETYNNLITTYTAQTASVPSLKTEINQYSSNIKGIINQFDGYEYYLYFESSSYAWPKVNSTKPYILQSTGSVSTWYNALIASAQTYDDNNYDNLEYSVPAYLKNDANNQPFLDFLNMVGHYFDNIWVYIKAITDINYANNNLEEGISRDLVYERLKSLGVKLYNTQAGEALSSFLIGANTGSSIFDNNFTVTGSYLNNIPRKDLVSELYKRIYHNLPLLAKTKGTAAGLGYLTTIFGITGSILSVKEYGGSTKSNLLHEYSTEKVRVVPNIIEGNILSPILSLQTDPTTYNDFRSTDTHYVDISFSPETQIDTYAASAIASVNPTWSLDDYIGDPRQQYYHYYPDLKTERTKYYQTGVTGYPGFTGSLMDYNGFIRLIQYFDNALFKMLADYVPERTSLSTGVTINSPVLERNKASYARPNNTTTQSVYTGEVSASRINAVYSPLYYLLTGSKLPYFNGELSGSKLNVYKYFQDGNFNPYLGDWNVYNSQVSSKQSINYATFKNSDFNVLINNVSSSVRSNVRRKIEYVFGTTGSILLPANLQDSYLTLSTYQKSRYDGVKTSSKTYNTWTVGDSSYGKTAAVDHKSYKIGWVKSVPSSSFNFYDKTQINLKYLVDANVNTVELNSNNNNLFEVQNIFKSGTPVVISISDTSTPSNQKSLDGRKIIWKGGYRYDPILFREDNESLTFTFPEPISQSIVELGISARCDDWYYFGSDSHYPNPPSQASTNNGTSNTSGNGYLYYKGNYVSNRLPSPSVGEQMSYRTWEPGQWKYSINTGNGNVYYNDKVPSYSNPYPNNWPTSLKGTPQNGGSPKVYGFNLLDFNIITRNEENKGVYGILPPSNVNNSYYTVPRHSTYTVTGQVPFTLLVYDKANAGGACKIVCILEKLRSGTDPTDEANWIVDTDMTTPYSILNGISYTRPDGGSYAGTNTNLHDQTGGGHSIDNTIWYDTGNSFTSIDAVCLLNSTVTANVGDILRLQFYLIDLTQELSTSLGYDIRFNLFINGKYVLNSANNNGTSYLPLVTSNIVDIPTSKRASLTITDTANTRTEYYNTATYDQQPALFRATGNQFIFNSTSTYLFTSSSTFTPESPTSDYYTPIVDSLNIQPFDLIRIGNYSNSLSEYYTVKDISIASGSFSVTGSMGLLQFNTLYYFTYDTSTNPNLFFVNGETYNYTYIDPVSNKPANSSFTVEFSLFNSTALVGTVYFTELVNTNTNIVYTFTRASQIVVTVDRPIQNSQNILSNNFAILRPKPDETSVILDFQKQPGDVSPTILIPYDANNSVLAAQGTIFTTLNPNLK